MSAVRRKTIRSNRSALSSPYARPAKKSSWSLSGFLSYLNPLRFRGSPDEERLSSDEDIDVDEEELEEQLPPSPVQTLSRRGQQLTENISVNGHAFPGPSQPSQRLSGPSRGQDNTSKSGLPNVEFTFKASFSPSKNLDTVSNFLVEHANQPIAPEDINQMVALIQQSKPGVSPSRTIPEYHFYEGRNQEPFRFESRSATTPPRSKSPSLPPRSTSATPRTLARNPNGSYTWKGAGSARARRTRNSFSSPAFRTNRSTSSRGSSTNAEVAGNDTKRRRLGDFTTSESQGSQANGTTQHQVPFPITSTPTASRTTTTTTSLKPPPVPAPIRQRTPGLQKPTAPVVPSPLRQAWTGGSPSGSESGSPQGPSSLRQTETAKHVTELVNSLKSQDKVLDELRNPYEAASPVKRPTAPKRKRVTGPAKKPAATVPTPKVEEKVRIREMSAHDIIEATLPEGSKRSRPPPDLEKVASRGKDSRKVTVVSDDEEDEEIRVPKRSKPLTNGHVTKESEDIEMHPSQAVKKDTEKPAPIKIPVINVPPSTSASAKTLFGPKSSMPKEPSKLRFSMQPEPASTPPSPAPEAKAELEVSRASAPSLFTFDAPALAAPEPEKKEIVPVSNSLPASIPHAPTVALAPKNAKDSARTQSLVSLPSFTFTVPLPSSSGNIKAKEEAKAMPKASLPSFDLNKPVTFPAPAPTTLQKGGFDWSAAGVKAPMENIGGEWTCNSCMLKNPASATTKCTICDTPKADAGPPKPQTSFDWSAAGMKPTAGPSKGEWVCNQCSLKNPATATTKCTICEAPKPGAAAESLGLAPSFNWAAAGMKPVADPVEGEWVCSQCSLKNPATATTKCTVCDASKPGTASPVSKPTGFNWDAAGMKAPVSSKASEEWACGLCGLKNPADAKTKCTICEAPRS